MTCDRADELLEEFVLGTLSLEEVGGIQSHITHCRNHDAALTELQAVASRLPFAAPDAEPAADLRARVMARFDAEVSMHRVR